MWYYKVKSSHWTNDLEFKSELSLGIGQCFRISRHSGTHTYPTRFKVLSKSESPEYSWNIVEIFEVDTEVEKF